MENEGHTFLKLFDKGTPYLAGLALFGLTILFLPNDIARNFGVDGMHPAIRAFLGVCTLAAISALLVRLGVSGWNKFRRHRRKQEAETSVLERLTSLSRKENDILAQCHKDRTQSVEIPILSNHNSAALALCSKGLLVQSLAGEGVTMVATNSPTYTIPDFVWNSDEFTGLFGRSG